MGSEAFNEVVGSFLLLLSRLDWFWQYFDEASRGIQNKNFL
jgi:hypothetical protein